uniref:Uncharacterized protein n=1 Tax=Mustela putorius furo TaxID=9669 RepID=M3Z4P6_MUSPF
SSAENTCFPGPSIFLLLFAFPFSPSPGFASLKNPLYCKLGETSGGSSIGYTYSTHYLGPECSTSPRKLGFACVCGGGVLGEGRSRKTSTPSFRLEQSVPRDGRTWCGPHYCSQQDRPATRSRPRVRLCKPGAAETRRRGAASPFPWQCPRIARPPEGPARRRLEPSAPRAIAAPAAGPTRHQHRTFHQKPAWPPPVGPTAARCTARANKSAKSSSLPAAEDPAASATDSERSHGRNSERSPPEFAPRRHRRLPAFAPLARVRGAGWPSPGLRATPPHGSPQFAAPRPPRPLTPASPSAGRAKSRRPGPRAPSSHRPTASRRRPIPPEGRRPRARNVSDGAPRRASTLPRMPPPPAGGIHHRCRSYPGREGGRERLSVLTLLTEQTTALEGAASPHPPAVPPRRTRAQAPPPSAGRRAGHAGSGSFPVIALGNRADGAPRPPGGSRAKSGRCSPPARSSWTLPHPSSFVPAVAQVHSCEVISDDSFFHTHSLSILRLANTKCSRLSCFHQTGWRAPVSAA